MAGTVLSGTQLSRDTVQGAYKGDQTLLEQTSCFVQLDAPAFPLKQRDAKFRLQPVDGL